MVLGIGGLGMLITGTPLAWVVKVSSWRTGFLVLAAGSALAWLVSSPSCASRPARAAAQRGHRGGGPARVGYAASPCRTRWGIVALGAVTYASFITLRGLWLGPLLIERYGFSLLQSGNVALAVSAVSLLGPPVFGRLDPGVATRRPRIVGFSLVMATRVRAAGVRPLSRPSGSRPCW